MTDTPHILTVTEADLLRLNAENTVEIVNGEVITLSPTGFLHNIVASNIYDLLRPYAKQHDLGYVASDSLIYVLEREGDRITLSRIPDVSFIRKDNIPEFDFNRPFPGAPDFAVEVVSPSESEQETLAKIRDYFAHGTEEAWVVYPNIREIHVYRHDDPKHIRVYDAQDILTTDSLFPGLRIQVSDCFILPNTK
ncbi:MAG: Uma2 family endonuclease [Anaerolineae bacterium]|nr:Uma2 family endonuclease [Anaerolineae bacterium]